MLKKLSLFALFVELCAFSVMPCRAQATEEETPPIEPDPGVSDDIASVSAGTAEEACFPSCRSGYVCHPQKLECVSICNPACDSWETCTEEAQCVSHAEAPKQSTGEADDRRLRLVLLGRFGVLGNATATLNDTYFYIEAKAKGRPGATLGFDIRVEKPVAKYVAVGGLISNYFLRPQRDLAGLISNGSTKPKDYAFDMAAFVKPRVPFRAGKREAEAYLLVNLGGSFTLIQYFDDASSIPNDGLGVGFNVGVTPGFQVFVAQHMGLVFEFGYAYTWFNIGGSYLQRTSIGQATLRFGFTFAFGN